MAAAAAIEHVEAGVRKAWERCGTLKNMSRKLATSLLVTANDFIIDDERSIAKRDSHSGAGTVRVGNMM